MKRFRTHLNEKIDQESLELGLLEMAMLMDEDFNIDMINESTILDEGKLQDIKNLFTKANLDKGLDKAGFKLHRGKGILGYLSSAGVGVAKLMIAGIRGDKEAAMKIVKSVKKKDVLDFLYKLDLGTLHLFTGPVHWIDAWTGWDLTVVMKTAGQKAAQIADIVKQSVDKIKTTIAGYFSSGKEKAYYGYLDKIQSDFK